MERDAAVVAPSGSRWNLTLVHAVLLSVTVGWSALAAVGCAERGAGGGAAPVELGHIHDLVSTGTGAVLVATHDGLYRLNGPDQAVLVGTERHELLALARLADGRLVASGHPDVRLREYRVEGLPPYLGLIESGDEGESWQVKGQLGKVEFHALASSGDGIYGVDANGGAIWLLDLDERWEQRGSVDAIDLAVDPVDPRRQVAIGPIGQVWTSDDGARSWFQLTNTPALMEIEWPAADQLYGIDESGTIWAAESPELEWAEKANGPAGLEAFTVDESGIWWAATPEGGIVRSENDGGDWADFHTPATSR